MNELITLKTSEGGKKTVSAKELYEGLGLNKAVWARWSGVNIEHNEFFNEGYDWRGVQQEVEGNKTWDFEISLEFAKHIAMMARTERSHQFRNYFLVCEAKLKEQQNMIGVKMSPMELLETQFAALKEQDKKIDGVSKKVNDLEDNLPLFNIDCKELQALVRKTGIKALGGYKTQAYNDNSLRQKVYQDIQYQIKREFGVNRYEAIKRSQLEKATYLVTYYELPLVLADEVILLNNQVTF